MLHRLLLAPARGAFGALAPLTFAALLASLSPAHLHAQRVSDASRTVPSDSLLAVITARGRAIAGYEEAVWRARASSPDPDLSRALRQIAFQTDSGWSVAFGRLSADRDTFFVEQLATQNVSPAGAATGAAADTEFTIRDLSPARADTGYLLRAARALDTATTLFTRVALPGQPYQSVVLPVTSGDWLVYLVPAPTRPGAWPLGGDVRYRVSNDGEQVREMRRLHLGIIDFDRTDQPDRRYAPGSHTTQIADLPEDTDVAHVLLRRPRVFEYVFTTHCLFMINEDGSIRLVMGRSAILGAE